MPHLSAALSHFPWLSPICRGDFLFTLIARVAVVVALIVRGAFPFTLAIRVGIRIGVEVGVGAELEFATGLGREDKRRQE